MNRPPVRNLVIALVLLGCVAVSRPIEAGDVTAFVTIPSPTNIWDRGYGAALTTTWFGVVALEGEAARIRGDLGDSSMSSFTGSALLAPPLGPLVPYGGIGIGFFRQSVGEDSDTGVVRCFVIRRPEGAMTAAERAERVHYVFAKYLGSGHVGG